MADHCGGPSTSEKLARNLLHNEQFLSRLRLDDSKSAVQVEEPISDDVEYFEFKQPAAAVKPVTSSSTAALPNNASFTKSQDATAAMQYQWMQWQRQRPNPALWMNQFRQLDSQIKSSEKVEEKVKPKDEDDAEMREAAKTILENLQPENDYKLDNSRFVAYLRNLADESQSAQSRSEFETWKQRYYESIADIEDDTNWARVEKGWEQYEGTGFGYEGFAQSEFGTYHFSLPIGANPYRSISDKSSLLEDQGKSLREKILLLEAIVHEDPNDAQAWNLLGLCQQANEIDAQAIGAFLKASQLNKTDGATLINLAASCANENCIPDALDALLKFLSLNGEASGVVQRDANSIHAALSKVSQANPSNDSIRLALSIISNMAGKHNEAVALLRDLSVKSDSDWSVKNRLGASLANGGIYEEALNIYSSLIEQGFNYPRVYYNHGIAYLCMERYDEASKAFMDAIRAQMPVDILTGVKEELHKNYTTTWEALKISYEMGGKEDLAAMAEKRMTDLFNIAP